MSTIPLLISSPADMLKKSRHELENMRHELNGDTVFNFFVTIYHIIDYVAPVAPKNEVKRMRDDPDFQMARFLCFRQKHFTLEPQYRKKTSEILMGARSGIARSGAVRSAEPVRLRLYCDEKEVRLIELADRLITKWEEFFTKNGIAL